MRWAYTWSSTFHGSAKQGAGYNIRCRTVARNGGKPANMAREGTVYSRALKKWVFREIQVDRSRYRYTEIVFDFETAKSSTAVMSR